MPTPTRLDIEGMHCAACVRRVRTYLEALATPESGFRLLDVTIGSALMEIDFVPDSQDAEPEASLLRRFDAAFADSGFTLKGITFS